MQFISRHPVPPLDTLVTSVWYFEGQDLPHAMERIVPNGSMQLLVNLRDDELRWWDGADLGQQNCTGGAALGGAFSQPILIDTAQQRCITGVSFVPGGAAAFINRPMGEFNNDYIPLVDISVCESLRDNLLEAHANSPTQVIHTWMCFLCQHYRADGLRYIHIARAGLEQGYGVQQVADHLSVSVRKLRQDFSRIVGLSPKTYARIHRLQRLTQDAAQRSTSHCDWASLAIKHGYFDQAHMIHDFLSLTGTTPANYQPRSPLDWNHILEDSH